MSKNIGDKVYTPENIAKKIIEQETKGAIKV